MALVGIEQIRRAADKLAGVAVRTPLLPQLWADADRPLWLKPRACNRSARLRSAARITRSLRCLPRSAPAV